MRPTIKCPFDPFYTMAGDTDDRFAAPSGSRYYGVVHESCFLCAEWVVLHVNEDIVVAGTGGDLGGEKGSKTEGAAYGWESTWLTC